MASNKKIGGSKKNVVVGDRFRVEALSIYTERSTRAAQTEKVNTNN